MTARTLLAIMLIGLCSIAQAQEPRSATIEFEAPTEYTDGAPITDPISYRVYQGARGGEKQLIGTITETQTTINSGLERGREYCWHVTAVVGGEESDPSNEDCKAFRVPMTVTITVR